MDNCKIIENEEQYRIIRDTPKKKLIFRWLMSPKEINVDGDNWLESVTFDKNTLDEESEG